MCRNYAVFFVDCRYFLVSEGLIAMGLADSGMKSSSPPPRGFCVHLVHVRVVGL